MSTETKTIGAMEEWTRRWDENNNLRMPIAAWRELYLYARQQDVICQQLLDALEAIRLLGLDGEHDMSGLLQDIADKAGEAIAAAKGEER